MHVKFGGCGHKSWPLVANAILTCCFEDSYLWIVFPPSLLLVQDTLDSDDSDADEDKYADQADMPGTKFDSKTRTTVRNLRIREDTAKYLYNLDPNSAFYDPKTRSMRENPFKNTNKDPSQ